MTRRTNNPTRKKRSPAAPAPTVQALPRAGVGVRLMALIYDSLLLIALIAVINVIVIAIFTPSAAATENSATLLSPEIRQGLMFPLSLLAVFGFYGYCWTRSGQTLGMQTWRLEVRDLSGQRLTWMRSLQRFLAACALPLFCALVSWVLNAHNAKAMSLSLFIGFITNYVWALLPLSVGAGRSIHDQLSQTAVLRVPAPERKPYRFLGLFGDKSQH